MRRSLSRVTLVCVDCVQPYGALYAINETLRHIDPARTLFFTNHHVPDGKYEIIHADIGSIEEYSRFILKELFQYIDTDYVLIIQADGYVVNGDCWTDDFFSVDYIGAKWLYPDRSVGNGGFSLRSKKLFLALKDVMIHGDEPEDHLICRTFRKYLEKNHDIKFASEELADVFSYETLPPTRPTFGFHKNYYPYYRPKVLIRRTASLGDLIMAEPIISYFQKTGWDVCLYTNPDYQVLFPNVLFEWDGNIDKIIDLDMAYEMYPKESVFDSYCKTSGIETKRRNSNLGPPPYPSKKILEKYALIHSPKTNLPYRNANVDSWESVVNDLRDRGYSVFQIQGNDIAPQLKTESVGDLMFYVGNADLFIGVDSGPLQIAVAYNIASVGLFGSVNWTLRYIPSPNLQILTGECPHQNCYHSTIGTTGTPCLLSQDVPQCTKHTSKQISDAINKLSK